MRRIINLLRPRRYARVVFPAVVVAVLSSAAVALGVSPITAAAELGHVSPGAKIASAGGAVYGGVTAQGFPVVIETRRDGRKVARAIVGIRLTCASGGAVAVPDRYTALSVNRKRKFGVSFGPVTNHNGDGTTIDFEGGIRGAFNRARTKVSGTWSLKATDHDASGAVTDTCDSGSVRWRAKR